VKIGLGRKPKAVVETAPAPAPKPKATRRKKLTVAIDG
jgi:hypothetical protein